MNQNIYIIKSEIELEYHSQDTHLVTLCPAQALMTCKKLVDEHHNEERFLLKLEVWCNGKLIREEDLKYPCNIKF